MIRPVQGRIFSPKVAKDKLFGMTTNTAIAVFGQSPKLAKRRFFRNTAIPRNFSYKKNRCKRKRILARVAEW